MPLKTPTNCHCFPIVVYKTMPLFKVCTWKCVFLTICNLHYLSNISLQYISPISLSMCISLCVSNLPLNRSFNHPPSPLVFSHTSPHNGLGNPPFGHHLKGNFFWPIASHRAFCQSLANPHVILPLEAPA